MGMDMAKMQDMENEQNQRSIKMNTFTNVKPNTLPDPIRSRVVSFVTINFSEEDILRRVPDSVAEAFLGDYLSATEQEISRVAGPQSDTVILRNKVS